MTYADAIADINLRRAALDWDKGKLAREARQSWQSVGRFLAGKWPDTDYRDFIAEQLQAALAAAEAKAAA